MGGAYDNCPSVPNPRLEDADDDGVGDACEPPEWSPKLVVDRNRIERSPLADATVCDVVRRALILLHRSGGEFTVSTDECIADDFPGTVLAFGAEPEMGRGMWIVVRGVNPFGNGTYDDPSLSHKESRDAEIDVSPLSCP